MIELFHWEAGEWAIGFDRVRAQRLLVLPPLFDEAGKMRHFMANVLRLLDAAGVDSFLPDLPGTFESLAPLRAQTLAGWEDHALRAASHFGATHVLALRGGAVLARALAQPVIMYAPVSGAGVLRGLARQQAFIAREAGDTGKDAGRDHLLAAARQGGGVLAGHALGAQMVCQLEASLLPAQPLATIEQAQVGGAGLWLRAEPGHDEAQALMLARLVLARLLPDHSPALIKPGGL